MCVPGLDWGWIRALAVSSSLRNRWDSGCPTKVKDVASVPVSTQPGFMNLSHVGTEFPEVTLGAPSLLLGVTYLRIGSSLHLSICVCVHVCVRTCVRAEHYLALI